MACDSFYDECVRVCVCVLNLLQAQMRTRFTISWKQEKKLWITCSVESIQMSSRLIKMHFIYKNEPNSSHATEFQVHLENK